MLALGGDWLYTANVTDGTVSRIDPLGEKGPDGIAVSPSAGG
jgi:hypothetical protein